MSPIANPLIQGGGGAGPAPPVGTAQGSPADATAGPAGPPPATALGSSQKALSGLGLRDPYNTPLGVGILVFAALGVVAALHFSGFRFILDAGVRSR